MTSERYEIFSAPTSYGTTNWYVADKGTGHTEAIKSSESEAQAECDRLNAGGTRFAMTLERMADDEPGEYL